MLRKLTRHLPGIFGRRTVGVNIALVLCILTMTTMLIRLRYDRSGPSMVEKAEEMYSRTLHMREACGRIPPQRHLKLFVNGRRLFFVSERYSLSYCEVAGASSTYWAQFFMALAGINPQFHDFDDAKSTFDLPRGVVHSAIKQQTGLTADLEDKRVKLTSSFLVARNPYSRLFSTYIDQIYLPLKWNAASKMVQNNPKAEECGSDISFDEFLSHISESMLRKKKADLSWAPVFSICLPCETDINIVVKHETLAEDADFVLSYINAEEYIREQAKNASVRRISEKELQLFVRESVKSGHSVNIGCISEVNLAKRIWSALQIKGIIRNDIVFPEEEFKDIFRDDLESVLTGVVLEAVRKSTMSDEEAEAQRREWKLSYWRSVRTETLTDVQASYYEDFMLFRYDIDPNKM